MNVLFLNTKTTSEGNVMPFVIYTNPISLEPPKVLHSLTSMSDFLASSFTAPPSIPQGGEVLLGHTAFRLYCHAFVLAGVPTSLSHQKILVPMLPSSLQPLLTNTPCPQVDLTAPSLLLRHFNTFLRKCTIFYSFIRENVHLLES